MMHHQPYACVQQVQHEPPLLHNHLQSLLDPVKINVLPQNQDNLQNHVQEKCLSGHEEKIDGHHNRKIENRYETLQRAKGSRHRH